MEKLKTRDNYLVFNDLFNNSKNLNNFDTNTGFNAISIRNFSTFFETILSLSWVYLKERIDFKIPYYVHGFPTLFWVGSN
jgi:hypothetical protein